MPKIRFSGRIIPAAFGVHINDLPVIKWKDADYEAEMIVKILDDEVHVDCTVAKYDSLDDAYQAYRRAIDFAKATVDLAAFATGKALTVLLEKITEPNGLTRGMAFNFPDLESRCTLFEIGKAGFANALNLIITEPELMWALRDLIETIEIPNRTPVNCARAIETLRVQITPAEMDRKKGWAILRKELQISEACLRQITDNSTSWRHGDRVYLDGETTMQIRINSWVIMNRVLEYRRRGNKTLPLSEFPLLT